VCLILTKEIDVQRLSGKVALVTGASRGIGRAIAVAFGQSGASVAITARSTANLEAVAAEVREGGSAAFVITADLGAADEMARIVPSVLERFGRIDILVNNAGIVHPRVALVDFDPSLWRQVIEVNLVAAAMLTRAVLPSMMTNGSGKIINLSSIGGRRGGKGRSAYRVTKAGLISLTESVAAEVKPYGIDAVCICPGGVDTEGYREAFGSRGRAENPNLMVPQEIASLAVFLASDESSAVTGTAIDAFGSANPLFI
jgi:3-oxoacyl-[acyl-carrier protein] reductase